MSRAGGALLRLCLLLCALLSLGRPLTAAEPENAPPFLLDIDAGGHRAAIKDAAFTPDGAFLVSASEDKTVRIWDWRAGVTVRTLRGQIGEGQDGKNFALAISPDGATVAVGGWYGPGLGETPPYGSLRLFDFATGKLRAVLGGADYPLYAAAFSPDGARLAAGGQDGIVFVWRRDAAAPSGWTEEGQLDADSNAVTRLAFLAGGARLAAATADNGIRLWNAADGSEIEMPEAAESWRDTPIDALAVSGDGKRFATGNRDGGVALWGAEDGALLGELPHQDFSVGALALAAGDAAGADRIVVSCGYRCADRNRASVWRLGDTAPLLEYREHDGSVFAGAVSPDGRLVATAGGTRHAIRVWSPDDGQTRAVLEGQGRPVTAVGIEAATRRIAWGNANPCPAEVACPTALGALEAALVLPDAEHFFEPAAPLGGAVARFVRAVFATGRWSLEAGKSGPESLVNDVLAVARDGAVVKRIEKSAEDGTMHSAFTLVGDSGRLVSGGNDGSLLDYDGSSGRLTGEFRGGHTGEVHAIAASPRLNLLLTGSADQTLRLWNLETRELIVSMFFAGSDWIFWLPQGYYTASVSGDRMVGWHVNQGAGSEARFTRAEQLRNFLLSPELVRRAIILRSAKQAVAEMRPGVSDELEKLLGTRPPEFDLRLAQNQEGVADGFVRLELSGADAAALGKTDFAVLSNSRAVGASASRALSGDGKTLTLDVPVAAGENSISVTGTDAAGFLTERSIRTISKAQRGAPRKGKLYVAAIGVDRYPFLATACAGRSCDLRFPVDDAAGFLSTVARRTAPMFSGMEVLLMVNRDALDAEPDQARAVSGLVKPDMIEEPKSDAIRDALKKFLKKPGPDDTTLLFVAGHGVNIDEDYYFLPTDARREEDEDGEWVESSLVEWSNIQKWFAKAQGTRVMLLDTCHAANAFNPRLEKDATSARIVVFSATAANNTAAELPSLGHGVFTYSLLEGLKGKAGDEGGVRMLRLADFLDQEVERLTEKRQKPFYFISNMGNFLLAGP